MISEENKLRRLKAMLTDMNPYLAIVFCNTKERASILAAQLKAADFNIGELHDPYKRRCSVRDGSVP